MYSDVSLSDPDELMRVTNNGKVSLDWKGVRRIYALEPGKPVWVPFHVCVRYLGDPRSKYKSTETFVTPTGDRGVIPERRGELVRLSINYGLYHAKIQDLPKVAPPVTVTTANEIAIEWPIFNPNSLQYQYDSPTTQNIDVRTELDRLRSQITQMEQRQSALISNSVADDPEAGEALVDTPPGM
jgi:hypothetical protein